MGLTGRGWNLELGLAPHSNSPTPRQEARDRPNCSCEKKQLSNNNNGLCWLQWVEWWPPQQIRLCPNTWYLFTWLYLEEGSFAGIIKLRTLWWRDHPGLARWILNLMTNILKGDTQGRFDRWGGDTVTTETETGVMWPGVKACWQPQQLEEAKKDSPRACQHLDFGFLNSRILQE